MKLYTKTLLGITLSIFNFSVIADELNNNHLTKLVALQETPPILSNGSGTLSLDKTGTTLSYTLTYANLSNTVTAAHIHFGHPGAAGAPIVFLCGGPKPTCPPANNGSITGVISASDILSVPAQGINAGDFNDLINVIRSGKAYVNVHTTTFPSGEIRGQISKFSI